MSCSEGFFYDESSLVCKPKCGVWTPLSPEADMAIVVLYIIGEVASIVICSTILVLSIVQCKKNVSKIACGLSVYAYINMVKKQTYTLCTVSHFQLC